MSIQSLLTTLISVINTEPTKDESKSTKAQAQEVDCTINDNTKDSGYVSFTIPKTITVKEVWTTVYSPKKSSNTDADNKDGKSATGKKETETENPTTTADSKSSDKKSSSKKIETLSLSKTSGDADPKKLGKNKYIVTTKDSSTIVQIGYSSFHQDKLSKIHVKGVEGKAADKSKGKSAAADNKTADAADDNDTAAAGDDKENAGKVLEFVSKDGIIIHDDTLMSQSQKDFEGGKTPSAGSSWYKSWWFWLIIVVAVVLIVFILSQVCTGSSSD
ncbi:hypothetical protein CDIK_2509 [Cucumispora dikerogammari]|nr:hypothetical protein CDIK_2509 [Cucumispora dikerogammari]